MTNEKLECPICKNKFLNLYIHLRWKHSEVSIDSIKEKYPGIRLSVDSRKEKKITCEICEKELSNRCAYVNHMLYVHKIKLKKDEKDELRCEDKISCNICGKKFKNLITHIKIKHNMSLEEYRAKFKYEGPFNLIDDEHKEKLSLQKKEFYASERGKEWRKWNSERFTGDANIACRKSVRKKISDSVIRRMIENNNTSSFFMNSFGIIIKFEYLNKKYHTRSFEEFKCLYSLLENNIDFNYEKYKFSAFVDDKYKSFLVDIKIDNTFYEIKGDSTKNIDSYYSLKRYERLKDIIDNSRI